MPMILLRTELLWNLNELGQRRLQGLRKLEKESLLKTYKYCQKKEKRKYEKFHGIHFVDDNYLFC